MDADEIIALLGLAPHPEGGFYRETFRDERGVEGRAWSTAIYFLLEAGTEVALASRRCGRDLALVCRSTACARDCDGRWRIGNIYVSGLTSQEASGLRLSFQPAPGNRPRAVARGPS